ncbi:MAG: InlB B-repeat-containing protein [Oscillospiraceae bacterium]|jgi:chitinase|nr:InlB B-repeat-containing protein [Oscillospiraceae bacterium]
MKTPTTTKNLKRCIALIIILALSFGMSNTALISNAATTILPVYGTYDGTTVRVVGGYPTYPDVIALGAIYIWNGDQTNNPAVVNSIYGGPGMPWGGGPSVLPDASQGACLTGMNERNGYLERPAIPVYWGYWELLNEFAYDAGGAEGVTIVVYGENNPTGSVTAMGYLSAAPVVLPADKVSINVDLGSSGGRVRGTFIYNAGENAHVRAMPDPRFDFEGWYENGVKINGAGESYDFEAVTDRVLEARFKPSIGTTVFNITAQVQEGGKVLGAGAYEPNDNAVLRAVPFEGYKFEGWYENGVCIQPENAAYRLTVTASRTLEARFEPIYPAPSKIAGAYFAPWNWDGSTLPDPNMFTHIFYCFSSVNFYTNKAEINRTGSYSDAFCLNRLSELKKINPNLKIILSVGGAGADGFSQMAATQQGRDTFVASLVDLMQEFNLDGFDIDWEFPGSSDAGVGYSPADTQNYVYLLRDIRNAIGSDKDLSVAAPPGNWYGQHYNYPAMDTYLDFWNAMTYCYTMGNSPGNCGAGFHDSNLYGNGSPHAAWPGTDGLSGISTDYTVRYTMSKGIPSNKINIGGQFPAFEYKDEAGYNPSSDYYNLEKIRSLIASGVYQDEWDAQAHASYLSKDGEFAVTYESTRAAAEKGQYVIDNNLAGIFSWSVMLDTSDFTVSKAMWESVNGAYKASTKYSVYVDTEGGGAVSGTNIYNSGASATVTATPNKGYAFDGWYEGKLSYPNTNPSQKVSSSASYTFPAASHRTLVAVFTELPQIDFEITSITTPSNLTAGTPLSFKAITAGGEEPLKYSYYVYSGGKVYYSNAYTSSNNFTYTFPSAGSYTIAAYADDSEGARVKRVIYVNIV